MSSQIVRDKQKKAKPSKPHPDFPLSPHSTGKWYKKVQGSFYYFGTWDDPDAALAEWLARKDDIFAGRDHLRHEGDSSGDDVAFMCNEFVEAKQQQLADGEIAPDTYDRYEKASDRLVEYLGKRRKLADLKAADFRRYRASWPKTWGSVSVNNEIAKVRAIINFAFESGIVKIPIQTGPNFKRVSRKKQRLERAAKPKRLFSAGEIHSLLEHADVQLRAMILLGINAGYGNADCGRLTQSEINFKRGWLEGLRPKTAIERAAWLWPETIDALKDAIDQRFGNAPPSLEDHVFITKRRQAWFRGTGKDDAITAAFGKLKVKAGCDRTGVGFYALRHTFETVAGDSRDQIAVNYVMGHCDDSMAAVYREGIDPQRIIDACSFVRDWWKCGSVEKEPVR